MAGFDLNYFSPLNLPGLQDNQVPQAPDYSRMPSLMDQILKLANVEQSVDSGQDSIMQARTQADEAKRKEAQAQAIAQAMGGGQPAFPSIGAMRANQQGGNEGISAGLAVGGMGVPGLPNQLGAAATGAFSPQQAPTGSTMSTQEQQGYALMAKAQQLMGTPGGQAMGEQLVGHARQFIADAQTAKNQTETRQDVHRGQDMTFATGQATNARELMRQLPPSMLTNPSVMESLGAALKISPEEWAQVAQSILNPTVTQQPVGQYGSNLALVNGKPAGISNPPAGMAPGATNEALSRHAGERAIDVSMPMSSPRTVHSEAPMVTTDTKTGKEYPGRRITYSNGEEEMRYDGEAPPMNSDLTTRAEEKAPTTAQREGLDLRVRKANTAVEQYKQKLYTQDQELGKIESTYQGVQSVDSAISSFNENVKAGKPAQFGAVDSSLVDAVVRAQTTGRQAVRTGFTVPLKQSESIEDWGKRMYQQIQSSGNLGPELRKTLLGYTYTMNARELADGVKTEADYEKDIRAKNPEMSAWTKVYDQAAEFVNNPNTKRYASRETLSKLKEALKVRGVATTSSASAPLPLVNPFD